MATKTEVGGIVDQYGIAVATTTYFPPYDRAALIKRVNLSNASALDNWTLTIGGREVARFRHLITGNQPLLEPSAGLTAPALDYFTYCRYILGIEPQFPVPIGMPAVVASVGGATADVDFEVVEVDPSDAAVQAVNHYQGRDFLIPITWYLAAAVPAAVGIVSNIDTQVAPPWVPNLYNNTPLPVSWDITLLALFIEGLGVNTFSGAADHRSTTQDVRFTKNGTQLFTRQTAGIVPTGNNGIPNRGKAAASGSANTVFAQQSGLFPPFLFASFDKSNVLQVPIHLVGGDALLIQLETQGDTTGTADYSKALIHALARVKVPTGAVA